MHACASPLRLCVLAGHPLPAFLSTRRSPSLIRCAPGRLKDPQPRSRQLTISLRNNRLYDCVFQLRDLLQHPAVLFVDISLNSVASIDSKDDMCRLSHPELQRLIFLQPQHLRGSVLDLMSNNDAARRQVIETAHKDYFSSPAFQYIAASARY